MSVGIVKDTGSPGDFSNIWRRDELKWREIINSTADYIVFIDADGKLEWQTSVEFDAKAATDPKYDLAAYNVVINDGSLLLALPCEGFASDTKHHIRVLVGEALACGFDHDYANAMSMLDAARQYFRARSEEVSRVWYLSASATVAAIFAFLGLLIWAFRDWVEVGLGRDFLWLSIAAALGALGALLSVIWRSGELKFDCSSGRRLHHLEAGSRIVAGAISGLLLALAVKYQIILGAFSAGDKMTGVMMIAALAGGSGERLASSIISKLDTADATPASGSRKLETK
jgi:hypothetical protein